VPVTAVALNVLAEARQAAADERDEAAQAAALADQSEN